VEYELAAEGLDEGAIAAAVEAISRGQARVGDAAPPFELADTRGKKVRLEGFRGKPLLLFWFSSTSKPSEAAAPALAEAFDNYRKRGVEVVAIAVREEGDAAKQAEAFGKRFHWPFPILIDPDADTVRHYGGLIALPKVAIVDPAGKLQYSQPGFDPDAVQAVLDKILTTK
jgi:peroxiredoxin Q/BCP